MVRHLAQGISANGQDYPNRSRVDTLPRQTGATMKRRRGDLVGLSLERAKAALAEGDGAGALEWLRLVPDRPRGLESAAHYQAAKQALARGEGNGCLGHLRSAVELDPQPLYQQRLALARKRQAPLSDIAWRAILAKIAPAARLPIDWLEPPVREVWACGAFYSRGAGQAFPWTRILRGAKRPGDDPEQHEAMVDLATGFLCRFLVERTLLLASVDVVVPIPPNPVRYAGRLMSLPDRIARAVEQRLGIPGAPDRAGVPERGTRASRPV